MRIFRAAALAALLAGFSAPASAQTPNINLMPEFQSKTPEEKETDAHQGKSLPGIVEENTRRQDLERSVGHGAHRRAAQTRAGQGEDQDRQQRELDECPGRDAALLQRCFAEPGPYQARRSLRPRLCSAPRREGRRVALRPGHVLNMANSANAQRRPAEYDRRRRCVWLLGPQIPSTHTCARTGKRFNHHTAGTIPAPAALTCT